MKDAVFSRQLAGITHEYDGFSGDCGRFVQKMARSCINKFGAKFVPNACAVELCTEGDRVTGIRTTDGSVYSADIIVLAHGAWAPALAQTANVWLPIVPVRGYSLEVPVASHHSEELDSQFRRFPNCIFPHSKLAVTGFIDGEAAEQSLRIRFTSVAEFLPVDAPQSVAMADYLRGQAIAMYPNLAVYIARNEVRVGSRPQTPDDLPIVSGTRYSNLFVNFGGCSYGWRFGCGMSAMLTALITGQPVGADMPDLTKLSLERFSWRFFLNRGNLNAML